MLARIDPRTYQAALDQAVAKKAQDQANLANARVDLVRYQKLAATAYTSAQQADTQKATVAQLEAQVAQDQAQIDSARTQLSYTTITAPIDGRTGIRQVDQGNIVHATDTTGIVVITTLQPISVVFTLPQQDAAGGRGGDAADGHAGGAGACRRARTVRDARRARPRHAGGARQPGRPDHRHDQAEGDVPQRRPASSGRARFVDVRLKVETAHDAIVVPPAAVQRGPQGAVRLCRRRRRHGAAAGGDGRA